MEHVRKVSKKIFGATYRLEVMAALSAGDIITLTEFARRLAPSPGQSSVAMELKTLEEAGLIERQPSVEGMRSVYLKVVVSPLWDTSRALAAWAEGQGGPDEASTARRSTHTVGVEEYRPLKSTAEDTEQMASTRQDELGRRG